MDKHTLISSLLLLAPLAVHAQDGKVETKGELALEGRKVEVDPASSKFNEYSDLNNDRPRTRFDVEVRNRDTGSYLTFTGSDILRKDQTLQLAFGKSGLWSLVLDHNETPHNLSLKAKTPFRNQGGGLLTVDSPVIVPNKVLAPTTAQLLPNDAATAAWLPGQLRPTELGTQRDFTGAVLSMTPTEHLQFTLALSNEHKVGSKLGYGVIGDRPPRSLAAQVAQPIDFSAKEMKMEAQYAYRGYQAALTYTVSRFENSLDTFRWQNPYATAAAGATFDQWSGHRVATFGQFAPSPDNLSQNLTLALGMNMPMSGRLSFTAAYGLMEQNQALLPYATSSFNASVNYGATASLPRTSAEAAITTRRVTLDYSFVPVNRLHMRAYFRSYDLDNQTPSDNWWYITSDTIPGAGTASVTTPTFVNQRRNLALAYKQTMGGLEASSFVSFWRTSFAVNVEREKMARHFREASTQETSLKASFRTRPTSWMTVRGKYRVSDRNADHYDGFETRNSYWYDTSVVRDNNNPAVSFDNHPDLRKYDVTDRLRKEWDLAATFMLVEGLDISLSFRDRKDNFDSNVKPTQPLAGIALAGSDADRAALTPGDQLGLLNHDTRRLALDVSYALNERFTMNAFASRESINLVQRGLEFNENNKLNPTATAVTTNELGPWTRRSSQWMGASEDGTDTLGAGAAFEFIPGKLRFAVDYTYTNGTVDIAYSGFGMVSALDPSIPIPDNNQYGFRTPTTVRNRMSNLGAHLSWQVTKQFAVGLHYAFERYHLSDWMQEANTPWFESVGSEYLLRDSSSATSTQWGNRLINLGSYLAPSYDAHFGSLSIKYTF